LSYEKRVELFELKFPGRKMGATSLRRLYNRRGIPSIKDENREVRVSPDFEGPGPVHATGFY
jgi:hypothetical protein